MKILLINTSDRQGGAALACYRLMKALEKEGNSVKMLVKDKQSEDADIFSVNTSVWKKSLNYVRFLWERFVIWTANRFSRENLFAVSLADTGTNISKHPLVQDADILHIHWINNGFLSLRDIRKLVALGKPIVWTMHDMWAFTAICHHARTCENYNIRCKDCPFLKIPSSTDLAARIWKRKLKLDYPKITFIACSEWLLNRAEKSFLLRNSALISIPNPIDTRLFCPGNKKKAKEFYGLDEAKVAILFGAAKVSNPRKGYFYFIRALELLTERYPELNDRVELIVFGASEIKLPDTVPYPVKLAGYVSSVDRIIALYEAADVFVTPSLEENLPNMVMESMACGTPVVGFRTGGIPEMIVHKQSGYIAAYESVEDLMKGIYWVLFEADRRELAMTSIAKVKACYSEEKVARQYMKCYDRLLRNRI